MRWRLMAGLLGVLTLAYVLSGGDAQAQPYAGPPTNGSISILIGSTAIDNDGLARVPNPAPPITGFVSSSSSNISITAILLGSDGNPREGAQPLEFTVNVDATGAFEQALPPDLPLGRYALYVNDSLVGEFDLITGGVVEPSDNGVNGVIVVLGGTILLILLASGAFVINRSRGY